MKKRIVILSAFATPLRSGAEACSEEVPSVLKDRFDLVLITARMRSNLPRRGVLESGVPILRLGFGCKLDKWLFPFLAPVAAARQHPHIIHAVLESYAGLALVFCRFTAPRAKRVLTCQSTNTQLLVQMMHCSADAVTAISSALVDRARKCGRRDITLIPNGLTLQDIPRAAKVPGRVLFVGRHEKMKGIDTLLCAFAQVRHPGAHLHLVGSGSQKKSYEKFADELGIADRTTFLGYVPLPDVYQEFAEAQVFCGLSRSEALGNVFLEAQAAECAVIGTRVGGIPDIVEDGKNGVLVEPDNVAQAAHAIEKLLSDDVLRSALGSAGLQHAAHYDWSQIAEKYAVVYEAVSD